MSEEKTQDIECIDYSVEMTNTEYRIELNKKFESIDDNRILRYFYIFVSEKLKRVL